MKTLFVLVLLSPFAALADYDDQGDVGVPSVRFLSWCAGNDLMSEDAQGRVVLKARCTEHGLRCVEQERPIGRGGRVIYANCK